MIRPSSVIQVGPQANDKCPDQRHSEQMQGKEEPWGTGGEAKGRGHKPRVPGTPRPQGSQSTGLLQSIAVLLVVRTGQQRLVPDPQRMRRPGAGPSSVSTL